MARLSVITGTPIYAWALMTNHAHLLLKGGPAGLSAFMRRFLTEPERELADERDLGNGDFEQEVLRQSDERMTVMPGVNERQIRCL